MVRTVARSKVHATYGDFPPRLAFPTLTGARFMGFSIDWMNEQTAVLRPLKFMQSLRPLHMRSASLRASTTLFVKARAYVRAE